MIQNPKDMSERKKLKLMIKIIKHFTEYAKDTDNLPP